MPYQSSLNERPDPAAHSVSYVVIAQNKQLGPTVGNRHPTQDTTGRGSVRRRPEDNDDSAMSASEIVPRGINLIQHAK
jgi:hypothetical protein